MKKNKYIIALVLLVVYGFVSLQPNKNNEAIFILHQMYDSIKNVRTVQLKINAVERLGKTYASAVSEIKLNTNPRKLYFVNRDKKLEILFKESENNNKALIKTNYIPNLNLDPRGNLMRKNQHYTIHELGFDFIGQSIVRTLSKDKEGLKNFVYKGKVQKLNRTCHLIQYENLKYNYVEYVVGNKETASSIASKLIVNDYLLRYNNNLLNEFGYLKKGTILVVPNLYCKKAILFIDVKMLLPVSVSLFDDIGLFENYEYPSIIVNEPLSDEVFNKENKAYRFN